MNIRLYPLAIGMALTACMTLTVTACNRQDDAPPKVMAPVPTTVGMEIDDTVTTTKVKSALVGDQEFKGLDIKVETRKGMVQLSGFVDNQARADRAMATARAVEGVKGVENGMSLKDGKTTVGNKIDDVTVSTRVKSALADNVFVKSSDIAVVTSKGEVQLSGFVDNQAQIDQAIKVTRAVEGVQDVVNKMSLKK